MNFLIALLAMPIEVAFLISTGQLFHNLAVSMQKLLIPALELAVSFQILIELVRNDLSELDTNVLFGTILKG